MQVLPRLEALATQCLRVLLVFALRFVVIDPPCQAVAGTVG